MSMDALWMGICPGNTSTRILAMRGPSETILKAHLRRDPSSPQALQRLLEAIALWEGTTIRAALAADDHPDRPAHKLIEHVFAIDDTTPLYQLQCVPYTRARKRQDRIRAMGDFRDLEQLVLFEVPR
jgi:hypothetical protein